MFLLVSVAVAATLSVGPTQAHPTIQSAIDAAAAGDTVLIDPGVYAEVLTIDVEISLMGAGPGVVIAPSAGQTPQPDNVAIHALAPVSFVDLTLDGRGDNNLVLAEAPTSFDWVQLLDFADFAVHGGGEIDLGNSYVAHQLGQEPAVSAGGNDLSAGVVRVRDTTFDDLFVAVRTDPGGTVRDSTFVGGEVSVWLNQVDNGRPPARVIGNDFVGGGVGVYAEPVEARSRTSAVLTGNLFHDMVWGLGIVNVTQEDWVAYYTGAPVQATTVGVRAYQNTFVGTAASGSARPAVTVTGDSDLILNSNSFVGFDVAVSLSELTPAPLNVTAEYNLTDGEALFDSLAGLPPVVSPTNLLDTDPMYTNYVDDGVFGDDFTPLAGSPLIDGGEPTQLDRDGSGTRADIGHHTWR